MFEYMKNAETVEEQIKNLEHIKDSVEAVVFSADHMKIISRNKPFESGRREDYLCAIDTFIESIKRDMKPKSKEKYINMINWYEDIDWQNSGLY